MTFFCLLVSIFCQLQIPDGAYSIFEENGKHGLKNPEGEVLIPARYEALGWTDRPFAVVDRVTGYKADGKWGLIDVNAKVVTRPLYSSLIPGDGNLIVARKANATSRHLSGCIDVSGNEIIPFQYDGLVLSNTRAIVYVRTANQYRYGLIDHENKVIIPAQYQHIVSLGSLRYAVQNGEGKYALFSEAGKPLTSFLFDRISSFVKDRAIVTQGNFKGLVDRTGLLTVAPLYRTLQINPDGTIEGMKPNLWTIIDGQNKKLGEIRTDSVVSLNNNLFAMVNGDRYVLANAQFSAISEQEYTLIEPFQKNKAIVKQDDRFGMISSNGKVLIDTKYFDLEQDRNFILATVQPNHWVLLDSLGNEKTSKTYRRISRFNGIYFSVQSQQHFGAVDVSGREILSCVYDSILQYHDGKLVVKFRGAYGIIDMNEEWIIPPGPGRLHIISNDRYFREKGPTTVMKSFEGEVIYFTENKLQPKGELLEEILSTGGRWMIDFDGRIVSRQMPPADPYEQIFPESEGLRGIKKNGRYGFIDDQGRLRIANRYEDIHPFQERLAAVKILNKWGFIDHDEKIVIQPVYEEVGPFQNGMSVVMQKGLYGLINPQGKLVLPARYDRITMLPTKRFQLESQGMKGLADEKGNLIFAPKYDRINDLNNGYVIVTRAARAGLITLQGISTIPILYDAIQYDAYNDRYFALQKGNVEILK